MGKLKQKFGNMSISRKLYLTILACLILPLILVFCLMNGIIGRKFYENQCEKELEVLKQSKFAIENLLNDSEMISRSLIGDKNVQTLLESYIKYGEPDEVAKVNLDFSIREIMDARKYLSSISIYRDDTILFQCGNYYEEEDTSGIPGLQETLDEKAGKPVWEAARIHPYYIAGESNDWVVSLQRNINHLYKIEKLGTERISIKEEYLCSLYQPLELSEDALLYIFDEQGRIVSSTDKEMLNTEADSEIVEKMTQAEGYWGKSEDDAVHIFYRIPLNGWTVVKVMDARQLNSQVYIVNVIIWLSLVLSLAFGFIFSYLQKKSIINPVIKLSRDAELVNGENFNIRLYTENKDEVGMLNRNIIQMTERISELIETVYKGKIHMKEAEIMSLQSQINPHFLYNTLDTLRWQAIEHEEDELAARIEALSNLFRHVLNKGQEVTTVRDELDHLYNYLAIQQGRFGERIQVEIEADEALAECKVMKLILQPLVENAFVHGLERKVGKGTIKVTVRECEGMIEYRVEDDGVGTDEEKINAVLDSDEASVDIFALKNVKERIQLKYGKNYGIAFHSVIGQGTVVIVRIPKITGREEA